MPETLFSRRSAPHNPLPPTSQPVYFGNGLMRSAQNLHRLIGSIYEAATTPDAWPAVLGEVAATFRATSPALVLGPSAAARPGVGDLWMALDHDQGFRQLYDQHYVQLDPRRAGMRAEVEGGVFLGHDLIEDPDLLRSEFYNDFLHPQQLFHLLGGIPIKNPDQLALLLLRRPKTAAHFGVREVLALRALLPHFQRALAIHSRLAKLEYERRAVEATLDWMPIAVFMLDAAGEVVHANEAATTLLGRRRGLKMNEGRLVARDPVSAHRLAALVQSALQPAPTTAVAGGAMTLGQETEERPLQILVAPLLSSLPAALLAPRARVMVFASDPENRIEHPAQKLLARYFDLTPTEAKVLLGLARGQGTREIADELSSSPKTVETHRKRIMMKTETHQQTDLVRLALSTPAALRLPKA